MADLDKPSRADIIASAAGGTVGPLVTGLLAMAAAVTHSPDLAVISIPAGAAADALTEHGFQRIAKAIRFQLAAERVSRFAEAVSEESGQPMDEFIDEHVTDANQRELLGYAVDAATAARSEWKIRLLARAYVRGAVDGDFIDETGMFIKTTREFEPGHARVLAATIRNANGQKFVKVEDLLRLDSGIGPAAALLWRNLRDHELLVADPANSQFEPTDLGHAVSGWLAELGDDPVATQNGDSYPTEQSHD